MKVVVLLRNPAGLDQGSAGGKGKETQILEIINPTY